jgi:hypothetical protein
MSFDPRSLERLRELGRSLPKPLPAPETRATPAPERPRHRVETETDPETLVRELMQASSDGTVPPHLMDRLRQLEGERQSRRQAAALRPIASPERSGTAGRPAAAPTASTTPATSRRGSQGGGRPSGKGAGATGNLGRRDPRLADAHGDLYTAFQQLLLEGDDEDDGPT